MTRGSRASDASLDEADDLEHRQVQRDDHAADDDAERGHHERLDERRESVGSRR